MKIIKAGAVALKTGTLVLPPPLAGKRVRGAEAAVGGTAARPAVRQTGNTVLLSWMQPVRVEPGKPLSLTIRYY